MPSYLAGEYDKFCADLKELQDLHTWITQEYYKADSATRMDLRKWQGEVQEQIAQLKAKRHLIKPE